MLKISEDKNLKDLEQFGFVKMTFMNIYKYETKDAGVYVNGNTRILNVSSFINENVYDLDIIYELIKAGLVEQVGE